nr:MAG TPA: hypothetical protein [Caudoviricetes sp.]
MKKTIKKSMVKFQLSLLLSEFVVKITLKISCIINLN